MSNLLYTVKQKNIDCTLSKSDIRDIETMLGMLEGLYNGEIPAAQRILKKLEKLQQPISHYKIIKTGICSAKSVLCESY